MKEGQRQTRHDVNDRMAQPTVAPYAKPARQLKDQRCQRRPQKPVRQLPHQHAAERRLLIEDGDVMTRKEIVVECEGQPDERPRDED